MNYCAMPDNLDTKKTKHIHSYPWQTQKLKYTVTNFCESLGKEKTLDQIDAAFETWQSVCGLKFKRLDDSGSEIKITFLNNHDEINCPYKLSGQKGGTFAHAFYPGKSAISGDIHLAQRPGRTRKQFLGAANTIYFQLLFMNLVIALDSFTILKTKTVLCNQFVNLDLVSKTRTRYFLNLILKQSKKCMARQKYNCYSNF